MNNKQPQDVRNLLKTMSVQDFLNIGVEQVAYIRALDAQSNISESENSYGIFAADGTRISVLASHETALAAIKKHDLEPVTVH